MFTYTYTQNRPPHTKHNVKSCFSTYVDTFNQPYAVWMTFLLRWLFFSFILLYIFFLLLFAFVFLYLAVCSSWLCSIFSFFCFYPFFLLLLFACYLGSSVCVYSFARLPMFWIVRVLLLNQQSSQHTNLSSGSSFSTFFCFFLFTSTETLLIFHNQSIFNQHKTKIKMKERQPFKSVSESEKKKYIYIYKLFKSHTLWREAEP